MRLTSDQETELWRDMAELDAQAENARHFVIEKPADLKGWHLVEAILRRPGVYKICITRPRGNGAEMINGFAGQAVITTARELGYLSAPNGYTLPLGN